ncbi:MAG: hypothetical protein ACI8WB_004836 [Phenylobacterium sp.]|jgi:uncharacterized protein (TIGR02646 family)
MRAIKKSNPGNNHNLNNAQKNNGIPASSDAATNAWSNFKDHNQSLFHKLLIEQYGLCCYTELNLADLKQTHNIGSHFEHEQPKSQYPQRTFDEQNLLRSVLDSTDLSVYRGSNRFGGHYKDNNPDLNYDEARFISPQSPGCRRYFAYLSHDGRMVPKHGLETIEQDKAQYTIDLLNLNAPFLKAERARYLKEIIDEIDKLMDDEALEAMQHLAECELTLTERQYPEIDKSAFAQLRSFHSATLALFGAMGLNVIGQHCNEIDSTF